MIDGGGASIICNSANCAAKGLVANATNVLLNNFKLVGTSGVYSSGDHIAINDIRIMTVYSNAIEVQQYILVTLWSNAS